MKHSHLLMSLIFLLSSSAFSQNIGVNEDGSVPDGSAIVDMKSSSRGLLIPRMDTTAMNSINNPARGLIIYDTTTNLFYYNKGTAGSPNWVSLLNALDTLPAISGVNLTDLNASHLTGPLPAISGAQLLNLTASNLSGSLPAINGSNLTNLTADNLTGTLPAIDGANLTNLTAANLSGALPAISGASLTNLNASNLSSGTVATARLGSGTASSSTYLRGDGTWNTPSSSSGTYTGSLSNSVNVTLGTTASDIASFTLTNKALVTVTMTATSNSTGRFIYITDNSDNIISSCGSTSGTGGINQTIGTTAVLQSGTYKIRGAANANSLVTVTNFDLRKIEF